MEIGQLFMFSSHDKQTTDQQSAHICIYLIG